MEHWTYDRLKELAFPATVLVSVDAEVAFVVFCDALLEAGVLIPWAKEASNYTQERDRRVAEEWQRTWAFRWAMKATYGPGKIRAQPLGFLAGSEPGEPAKEHRRWTELRIELWKRRVQHRGNMTRPEIEAALQLPVVAGAG